MRRGSSPHVRVFTCRGCGRLAYGRTVREAQVRRFCSLRCKAKTQTRVGPAPVHLALCQRPGCGNVRTCKSPYDQRHAKYCSHRCSALVNKQLELRPDRHAVGVANSVANRKRRVLARVATLSPLDAFKLGYKLGITAKSRRKAAAQAAGKVHAA